MEFNVRLFMWISTSSYRFLWTKQFCRAKLCWAFWASSSWLRSFGSKDTKQTVFFPSLNWPSKYLTSFRFLLVLIGKISPTSTPCTARRWSSSRHSQFWHFHSQSRGTLNGCQRMHIEPIKAPFILSCTPIHHAMFMHWLTKPQACPTMLKHLSSNHTALFMIIYMKLCSIIVQIESSSCFAFFVFHHMCLCCFSPFSFSVSVQFFWSVFVSFL